MKGDNDPASIVVGDVTIPAESVNASKQYMNTCMDRVLKAGSESVECDPEMQQRRQSTMSSRLDAGSAAAFNATAMNFLTNIGKLFPTDAVIMKMKQELQVHMHNRTGTFSKEMMKDIPEDTKPVNIPALAFARQVTQEVLMPDGSKKTIANLIQDKDEYLATANYNVELLRVMNFKTKYAALNATNREYVWKTLNKLLMAASMVVMVEHDHLGAVDDLIGSVLKKSKTISQSSGGRLDIRKASQMIAMDKNVRAASKRVVSGALEGDENVKKSDTPASEPQKISSEQLGEYISEMTGKAIDVAGLADRDGMVDLSDQGMERMMNIMAAQGASAVHRGTAKEANMRDRLKKKIMQRAIEQNANAAQPARAHVNKHRAKESDSEYNRRVASEVDELMRKMQFE
ncbi:MAG: hypothetical protein PHN45_05015 [Methylococcales bacterium]|nr:hypothetical protein [Methylococcales bacterium]